MSLDISESRILILKICAVIIIICLVILGIDRFIVQPTEPTEAEGLAAAAAELDMALHRDYGGAAMIRDVTRRLGGLVPPAEGIGAALVRVAEDHELIVYEHRYESRTMQQSRGAEVELLGILIRLPDADLPSFALSPGGELLAEDEAAARAVLTREGIERMASFTDFVLAAQGEHVLFLSRPPTSTLITAIKRSASPEFLPGLRNSGLKIDIQRAIDVTNRLALDRAPIPSVYRIDPNEIRVDVEVPELDLGLQETVDETHRQTDEIMEKHRRESEARQAEFQAEMEAIRERMKRDLPGDRPADRTDVGAEELAPESVEQTGDGDHDDGA